MEPNPSRMLPIGEALKVALEHQRAGRAPQAEAIYRQVLAVEPRNPHALHLLGLMAYQAGDLKSATNLISEAIAVRSDVPDYHANLGEAWRAAGEPALAAACLRRALALEPGLVQVHINLANALTDEGQLDEAQGHYAEAATRLANDVAEIARQASGLEMASRLAGARTLVERGLAISPDDPELNVIAARLDRREGTPETGIARLDRLTGRQMDLRTSIQVLNELGLLCDRAGETGRAFQMFEAAGAKKAELHRIRGVDKSVALETVERMGTVLTPSWPAAWRRDEPKAFERPAPVFLVGFPRSGTTLLEQVLASHSAITTLEERPLVEMLARLVDEQHGGCPEGLAALTAQDIVALRQVYFDAAASLVSVAPGQVFIDKFPLNIVRLPLIARVFPDARFILALRHPADVVLSNFMQNFRANEAMANFCTPEDAAVFYDRVMTLWRRSAELMPLQVHAIRYEDLVDDFDGQVTRLLDFLDLPWEEGVRDYRDTSRRGRTINTPSYHQVAEPIYRRAVARWRRYEPHLQPVMPRLAPWIGYFGY